MRIWMIINLLLQLVYTRIELSDIQNIQKTIIDNQNRFIIKSSGPLNPLHGYIYINNSYMHNKRFYSPEIKTSYSMKVSRNNKSTIPEYVYVRTPLHDKVYQDLRTGSVTEKYLGKYHSRILKMFPSRDGIISITSSIPDSLFTFLKAESTVPYTNYILASLLLLGECADIRIRIDYNDSIHRLILYNKDSTKMFINAPLYVSVTDPVTGKSKDKYQSEVVETINFFIQSRTNPDLKKHGEFSKPITREEFLSCKFMNSTRFLIQSYIFEFIQSRSEYIEFIRAVYEILNDQLIEESVHKKKSSWRKLFEECFTCKDDLNSEIMDIMPFYKIKERMALDRIFPLQTHGHVPTSTRVPIYIREDREFSKNNEEQYSNCAESAILGLFYCLVYDEHNNTYTTEHIPNASSDLIRFFKKYTTPSDSTDIDMHKLWCTVVSDLEDTQIQYNTRNNNIMSGLINIYRVISGITGMTLKLSGVLNDLHKLSIKSELSENDIIYIQECIKSLLLPICTYKRIRIICSSMKCTKLANGIPDIIGNISIIFTSTNGIHNEICLMIQDKHTKLILITDNNNNNIQIINELTNLMDTYTGINYFIGYLITEYIKNEIIQMCTSGYVYESVNEINEIIRCTLNNPSVLHIFLYKRINNQYKSLFILAFLTQTILVQVPYNNNVLRLTYNLIGSSSLDDTSIRNKVLYGFIYNNKHKLYYPDIEYTCTDLCSISIQDISYIYNYIMRLNISCMIECLNITIELSKPGTDVYNILYTNLQSELFISKLVETGCINQLIRIYNTINKYNTDRLYTNYTVCCWFTYVCIYYSYPTDYITYIYGIIISRRVYREAVNKMISSGYIKNAVYNFKMARDALCTGNEYNKIIYEEMDKIMTDANNQCTKYKKGYKLVF
ncbi:hypothetical protein NEIRO03_2163 [Nematocida sp. AWRm78]|nr:hypothetical protein NEIRO03_2163 [Nematocida sp. AWRm78]